jgi:hypothetical protein
MGGLIGCSSQQKSLCRLVAGQAVDTVPSCTSLFLLGGSVSSATGCRRQCILDVSDLLWRRKRHECLDQIYLWNCYLISRTYEISIVKIWNKVKERQKHEILLQTKYCFLLRHDSSVGIATGYRLDGPGIESWWRRNFPHTSGPAHPASYTMGTASFPRVKWPGLGVHHPPTPSVEVKE